MVLRRASAQNRSRTRKKSRSARPAFQAVSLAVAVFCIILLSVFVKSRVLPTHHEDLFFLRHHEHPVLPRRPANLAEAAVVKPVHDFSGSKQHMTKAVLRPNQSSAKRIENVLFTNQSVAGLGNDVRGKVANVNLKGEKNGKNEKKRLGEKEIEVVAADGSVFFVRTDSFSVRDADHSVDLSNINSFDGGATEASLAFFIQLSEANLGFLPRLLSVMWHPGNIYVLHMDHKIDRKLTAKIVKSIRSVKKFENVHILPSEPITYKGVSMLLNTLSAIEFLLNAKQRWDYFINLSGSDYPLINIGNMRRILGQKPILSREVNFLQLSPNLTFWDTVKGSRFDYVYYDSALGMKQDNTKLLHTWMAHPIADAVGVKFVQAEAWVIAHRSFARFAARSSYARKLLLLLSMMQDPEEHFFAMLAWNNKQFNTTLAHHAFRGIYWDFNGKRAGQHPYYVDEPTSDGEYPFWKVRIAKSRCFFARKFQNVNSDLLRRIDQELSGNHKQADRKQVMSTNSKVKLFVKCISEVESKGEGVRGHNPCWKWAEEAS